MNRRSEKNNMITKMIKDLTGLDMSSFKDKKTRIKLIKKVKIYESNADR